MTALLLVIGAVFAQQAQLRTFDSGSTVAPAYSPNTPSSSRAVIFYEGFEGTTGGALPTGWITVQNTPATPWVTISSTEPLPGVNNPVPAHTGDRSLARSWQDAGRNAWAITPGISLTEGVGYNVTFWFIAAGYPAYFEHDDFEVRIGQTPTLTGMAGAHLLFSNINNDVNSWTLAECFFIAPTTGTFYLGFHDLNTAAEGIFIYFDDIEVAECECCPVSNFTVNYTSDCKAELKWDAPTAGSPLSSFSVYRNGEEIATVNTGSYIDDDFEPTLSHTWAVKVACQGGGTSVEMSVSKPRCANPDCEHLPKRLSVNYNEDCDEAELKWYPHADLLWDNTEDVTMYLRESTRWIYAEFEHDIVADDFVIPAGETWTITEVIFSGSHSTNQGGDFDVPDFFGIQIYNDKNDFPGDLIYDNAELLPVSGNMSAASVVILLPEAFTISTPGKYWISCHGVYENINLPTMEYYVFLCEKAKESNMVRWTESNGPEWERYGDDLPSMFFRINGSKSQDPLKYNIYRDGELIAENQVELSFIDKTFNPGVKHTWAVKVACPGGSGVSAPTIAKLGECGEESIVENPGVFFTIFPNPSPSSIEIMAESNINKVEIINFLGQTVLSQLATDAKILLNVSNLNSGIYFVRIFTESGIGIQKFIKQ